MRVEDIVAENDLAAWFSGELRVPLGKQLWYIHLPYQSMYERDLMLTFKAGVVTGTRTIDNSTKERPEYGSLENVPPLEGKPIQPKKMMADGLRGVNQPIVPGVGVGALMLGTAREEIERTLGPGELIAWHRTRVDHNQSQVQVLYDPETAKAIRLDFYYRPRTGSDSLATDMGIGWNSPPAKVLEIYGKPKLDHVYPKSPMNNPIERRIIEYSGIDFVFEGNQLVRIGVSSAKTASN